MKALFNLTKFTCSKFYRQVRTIHVSEVVVDESLVENFAKHDTDWLKNAGRDALCEYLKAPPNIDQCQSMVELIDGRSTISNDSKTRLLSSLLTFPTTLAYGVKKLFPFRQSTKDLKVLVVGARSESSLPLCWWREYLTAGTTFHSTEMKMIGPGLQLGQYKSADWPIQWNSKDGDLFKLHLHDFSDISNVSLLHERTDALDLIRWAELIVLFNPGMGSPVMKEQWSPTILLLLETRKPILCTALGNSDLRRDLEQLDRISSETDDQDLGEPLELLLPPHLNPFRSFRSSIDKKEENHECRIATANHSIYAFQAK